MASSRKNKEEKRARNDTDEDNGFAAWGGYMEAKKSKLLQQFNTVESDVKKLSSIFNNVAILVNGYTNPGAEELRLLMASHGGIYHHYQMSSTTHIIASNLPNVKIKQLDSIPVVKPSWITDSIAREKLLDYKNYLLYTNQSRTQPKLQFSALTKTNSNHLQPPQADPLKESAEDRNEVGSSKEPQRRTLTAADPQFLNEFYSNSRLHLISTLAAELKQLVGEWREKSNGMFPSRDQLQAINISEQHARDPIIMHIDMDCFFVSVGLRAHPELRGKPVAVTHARKSSVTSRTDDSLEQERAAIKERFPEKISRVNRLDAHASMSEIASCSYEARKCGVNNGMFLGAAVKLCPDLRTIPYDFDGYREVSHILYETIAKYTLDIEAVSCDELYVDVGPILQKSGMGVTEWAQHIRNEISLITGCPCSTGFGANKLQARLATRKAKPNGFFHLKPFDVDDYMAEVALESLPGVGYATVTKLNASGFRTCADLRVQSLGKLQGDFGQKMGQCLYDQCRGVDKKPLNFYRERKSVSADVNYGIRFKTNVEALAFLQDLSAEVFNRLSDIKMKSKCLTLKLLVRSANAPQETAKFLGCGICDAINKSVTSVNLSTREAIFNEAKKLFEKSSVPPQELRGMGIQLTRLEKQKTTSNLMSKFLHGTNDNFVKPKSEGNKCKIVQDNKNNHIIPKEETKPHCPKVDLAILQELPEDIRSQVIKEYNLQIVPKPAKKSNSFSSLSWDEIKIMLSNWLKSTNTPLAVDTKMIGEHLKECAIMRRIEQLQITLNFLHRHVENMGVCAWHDVYCTLVDMVQEGMVARYGSTLLVNRHFSCVQHGRFK